MYNVIIRTCICHFFLFKDEISFAKIASQSHTYVGTHHEASNAVDGNTTTCMRTVEIGKNAPKETVWWKVDLGAVYNIYRINILFKNYEGYGVYFNFIFYNTVQDLKKKVWSYDQRFIKCFVYFYPVHGKYILFIKDKFI